MHSILYLDYRHDLFRVCAFIAFNAILANFLPDVERIFPICGSKRPKLRTPYIIFVDMVAGFGMNWRVHLPSLDQEFLGFRRTIRHGYRNWRQIQSDRRR